MDRLNTATLAFTSLLQEEKQIRMYVILFETMSLC